MNFENITPSGVQIIARLIECAKAVNYDLNELQAGYNSRSGYFYIWSEFESYSIGITDFAYYRGNAPEFIATDFETGTEFITDDFNELCNYLGFIG